MLRMSLRHIGHVQDGAQLCAKQAKTAAKRWFCPVNGLNLPGRHDRRVTGPGS
jgi:hypothetical protein